MRNLNTDQLQAFVTVIEEGGFTNAARALHITQPAVSFQVRELETRCGVTLIDRSGRRPRPTPAGSDMLLHAKRILADQEAALQLMRRHRDEAVGRVRIGMSTTILLHIAGVPLRHLKAEQPTLQLAVSIGITRGLTEAVIVGDLDLAIVTLPVNAPELVATNLVDDQACAIFPAAASDLPAEATPSWLAGQPFIGEERQGTILAEMIRKWFADDGSEFDSVMRVEHLEAIKGAVAAGLGVAIVPGMLVLDQPPTIAVRPLLPPIVRTIGLIQRAAPTSPAVSLVKQHLVEHAARLAADNSPAAGA